MAELAGFDAREVEPAVEFAPLPAGKYIAAIVESETKPTKAGGGSYLQLKVQKCLESLPVDLRRDRIYFVCQL